MLGSAESEEEVEYPHIGLGAALRLVGPKYRVLLEHKGPRGRFRG